MVALWLLKVAKHLLGPQAESKVDPGVFENLASSAGRKAEGPHWEEPVHVGSGLSYLTASRQGFHVGSPWAPDPGWTLTALI